MTQMVWFKNVRFTLLFNVFLTSGNLPIPIDLSNICVFHCFSGSEEEADKALSYEGFKLGIGGVVTYKNSTLPEVLKRVKLEHIVIETDSPYLSPSPFRGKRNESMYLRYVVKKLADIYMLEEREIVRKTSENAKELFNLDKFIKNE